MKANRYRADAGLVRIACLIWCIPTTVLCAASIAADPPSEQDYAKDGKNVKLHFREDDVNDTPPVYVKAYQVTANHNETHCKSSKGPLDHYHHQNNYGGDGMPPCTAGNVYYNWLYQDFEKGVITRQTDCTMQGNCWSAAFDKYKPGSVVEFWVEPNRGGDLVEELKPICEDKYLTGICENCDKTEAGDRCVESGVSAHAWWILEPVGPAKPTKCRWKDAGSGEYEWDHPRPKSNCAPEAQTTNQLHVPDLILRRP